MHTVELECIIHEFNSEKQQISDILLAQLAFLGYYGFMETDEGLKAYIPEDKFDIAAVRYLSVVQINNQTIDFTYHVIKEKNWNETWEKSFKPVIVEDKCIVRAPFHKPAKNFDYDIIIEPKMSFGTGHHATTFLMIKKMLEMDFTNKSVLDMGCGTGVLAILAEKLGAKIILAVDNNEWAYKNTLENIEINSCKKIEAKQDDKSIIKNKKFDIILANINRNVLLEDIPVYSECLNDDGTLILSGIYTHDMDMIKQKAVESGLDYQNYTEKNNWISVQFNY